MAVAIVRLATLDRDIAIHIRGEHATVMVLGCVMDNFLLRVGYPAGLPPGLGLITVNVPTLGRRFVLDVLLARVARRSRHKHAPVPAIKNLRLACRHAIILPFLGLPLTLSLPP
jgi:hypothetical protein